MCKNNSASLGADLKPGKGLGNNGTTLFPKYTEYDDKKKDMKVSKNIGLCFVHNQFTKYNKALYKKRSI